MIIHWTQGTIILWTQKYYYSLNIKVRLFTEPQGTIILWIQKYYYYLNPKVLLLSEPTPRYYYSLNPTVLLFSEHQGTLILWYPRYYYSLNPPQGTIILWTPRYISIFRVNRTQINKFRRKLYLFDQKSDQGIFRIIFEKTWFSDNLVAYITMSATISKNHGKVLYTKKSGLIANRLGE